jgi:hypothetical protein
VRRRHGALKLPDEPDPKVMSARNPQSESSSRIRVAYARSRRALVGVHRCCHPRTASTPPHENRMNPLLLALRHTTTRGSSCVVEPPQQGVTSSHSRGMTVSNMHAVRVSVRRNPVKAHRSQADGVSGVATRGDHRADGSKRRRALHDPGLTPWISAANVPGNGRWAIGPNRSPCDCS